MFTGIDTKDKIELIRRLLRARLEESFFGRWLGSVDKLSPQELIGSPEGTAVSIVEAFFVLKEQGKEDDDIIKIVENHRSAAGRAYLYKGMALHSYVYERVRIEHSGGQRLTDRNVDRILFITEQFIKDFYITSDGGKNQQEEDRDDDFVITPNMPSLTARPIKAYLMGTYACLVFLNPVTVGKTLSDRAGVMSKNPPIEYSFVLGLFKRDESQSIKMIVTLERMSKAAYDRFLKVNEQLVSQGMPEYLKHKRNKKLCFFDSSGAHHHIGDGEYINDVTEFVIEAEKVIQKHLGTREAMKEIKLPDN